MTSDQSCRAHEASVHAFFPAGLLRCAALAMICFALVVPAQAAEKAAAKSPAAAAEARLPNDDIAIGMLSRARSSGKDNIAVLAPLDGVWDYAESFWADPKAGPEHGMGTVTNEFIMERHFLSSKASGNLNIGREQIPFESQELIGFDSTKKSLSFVAIDTVTTGMTTGTGTFDEKAKVIKETGRFTNPLTGAEQDFRSEIALVDADHYKRTVYAVHKSGRNTKLMETDYTKRK